MKQLEALRELAEITHSQWGLVTSAQAATRSISHLTLARLADSGDMVRLTHGVYRAAGAPSSTHEELRAAWLSVEPKRLAWERIKERPGCATVSGESAARLLRIGEFRASRSEFTTPDRKQTQRADVRYRTRVLTSEDVTLREGLPVTTVERTLADLVESRAQLDHIGGALRDAARNGIVDVDRLVTLLNPLAERNGHRKDDGEALLQQLLVAASLDSEHVLAQIHKILQRLAPTATGIQSKAQEQQQHVVTHRESFDWTITIQAIENTRQRKPKEIE